MALLGSRSNVSSADCNEVLNDSHVPMLVTELDATKSPCIAEDIPNALESYQHQASPAPYLSWGLLSMLPDLSASLNKETLHFHGDLLVDCASTLLTSSTALNKL